MAPVRNTAFTAPARGETRGGAHGDGYTSLHGSTRRVYDLVAGIYPLSTLLFHEKAHKVALSLADIRDGMRVLEVATGSGEMFRRLVEVNPRGTTFGLDLSPNMAARTQNRARREFAEFVQMIEVFPSAFAALSKR